MNLQLINNDKKGWGMKESVGFISSPRSNGSVFTKSVLSGPWLTKTTVNNEDRMDDETEVQSPSFLPAAIQLKSEGARIRSRAVFLQSPFIWNLPRVKIK